MPSNESFPTYNQISEQDMNSGADLLVRRSDGSIRVVKYSGQQTEDGRYRVDFDDPLNNNQKSYKYISPETMTDEYQSLLADELAMSRSSLQLDSEARGREEQLERYARVEHSLASAAIGSVNDESDVAIDTVPRKLTVADINGTEKPKSDNAADDERIDNLKKRVDMAFERIDESKDHIKYAASRLTHALEGVMMHLQSGLSDNEQSSFDVGQYVQVIESVEQEIGISYSNLATLGHEAERLDSESEIFNADKTATLDTLKEIHHAILGLEASNTSVLSNLRRFVRPYNGGSHSEMIADVRQTIAELNQAYADGQFKQLEEYQKVVTQKMFDW